jgi:hypothetical protein
MKKRDAMMVVMRKMLIVAYRLLRTKAAYDPTKVWLQRLDNLYSFYRDGIRESPCFQTGDETPTAEPRRIRIARISAFCFFKKKISVVHLTTQ